MSHENMEIVRRALEAATSQPPDWPTVNALFDPEHELVQLTNFVDRGEGTRRGAAGFRDWRTQINQAGDWRAEIDEARATPDGRVVVLLRFLLTGGRSGAQVEQRLGVIVSIGNGKVTRTTAFATWQEALEAAGLAE